jgi:Double zinc ribbon
MARLSLFKRTRRSGDADQFTDSEPEPAPQPPRDEQAAAEVPVPELSPAEITPEEPTPSDTPAEEPEQEKPADAKQRRRLGKSRKARAPRPPVANLSRVRRERRALMRERERRIRDLGGLMLEMYRRDQFHEDLIVEHCAQAMGIENRIHELETVLMRTSSRRATPGPQCACGAPLLFGARFCANCGRPTELAAAGAVCARCLQPLAVGADFCASCGAPAGSVESSSNQNEQTIEHAPPAEAGNAVERGGDGET